MYKKKPRGSFPPFSSHDGVGRDMLCSQPRRGRGAKRGATVRQSDLERLAVLVAAVGHVLNQLRHKVTDDGCILKRVAGGPGGGGGRHGDAVKRVQPFRARALLASLEGGQQPQVPSLAFMTRSVPHEAGVLARKSAAHSSMVVGLLPSTFLKSDLRWPSSQMMISSLDGG